MPVVWAPTQHRPISLNNPKLLEATEVGGVQPRLIHKPAGGSSPGKLLEAPPLSVREEILPSCGRRYFPGPHRYPARIYAQFRPFNRMGSTSKPRRRPISRRSGLTGAGTFRASLRAMGFYFPIWFVFRAN